MNLICNNFDRDVPQDVPEGDIEEGAVGGQLVYSYAETRHNMQMSQQRLEIIYQ